MAKRVITPDMLETIKSMTMQGYSQNAIGDELGVRGTTIGYYQKKLGLAASNKWDFGGTAEKHPEPIYKDKSEETEEVKEVQEPIKQEPKRPKFIDVVDKTIIFTGSKTNFKYTCGNHLDNVKIEIGYSADIEIDVKDLVAFGNELLDVAEEIANM